MSNSATAQYDSGTGTTSLVFKYTVGVSDNDSADLSVSSYSGTILDEAGNAAGAVIGDLGNVIIDVTAPTISSITINNDGTTPNNDSVTVTFNESVYTNINGTGDLSTSDFELLISGGSIGPQTASISSVSKNSQSEWLVAFTYAGAAAGGETLTVNPHDGSSIYDIAGNAANATQSNNTASMNSD